MRKFINYIKSCFCKHDWELIFNTVVDYDYGYGDQGQYSCKVYRCKKCGYSKKYKNY